MSGEKGMTKVTGLLGYPAKKNLSAYMHNAGFKELGLDYVYLLFEVKPADLKEAVCGMKALNFAGFNLTIPFKTQVLPLLDELTPEADVIGAVNTVWNEGGKLVGDNTDGKGFLLALKEEKGVDPAGKRILLLGAGGAARAIAMTLAWSGAGDLFIYDLDEGRAENLAEKIGELKRKAKALSPKVIPPHHYQELKEVIPGVDILINATPAGMYNNPENTPVPPEVLEAGVKHLLVYDIINNPYKTRFLQLAEKLGADVLNGLPMLAYQGILAFQRWTGVRPPAQLFKEAARAEVEEYSF